MLSFSTGVCRCSQLSFTRPGAEDSQQQQRPGAKAPLHAPCWRFRARQTHAPGQMFLVFRCPGEGSGTLRSGVGGARPADGGVGAGQDQVRLGHV